MCFIHDSCKVSLSDLSVLMFKWILESLPVLWWHYWVCNCFSVILFHAQPFTVCLNFCLWSQYPPTFYFHKTKHVHALAEKSTPPSPCLVFQGLVEQRKTPRRNIMATCDEILIRRKWGGTLLLLFSINLLRWTPAACQTLMWHTEGVCLRWSKKMRGQIKGGLDRKKEIGSRVAGVTIWSSFTPSFYIRKLFVHCASSLELFNMSFRLRQLDIA